MLNIDTRILKDVDQNEFWLLMHLTKRLNSKRECWPSNKSLCSECDWHIEKLQKVKKSLVEKNLLTVIERRHPEGGLGSNIYRINTKLISVFVEADSFELEEKEPVGKSGIGQIGITGGTSVGKSDNEVLVKEVLTKEVLFNDSVSEVIDILNNMKLEYLIRGKVSKTPSRSKLISARLKESKTNIEVIKKMIEHKCKDWKGTKFEKFIRIETLFQAGKFQGYIEEAEAAPEQDWLEKSKSGVKDVPFQNNMVW